MKITETIDWKLCIGDIETYKKLSLFSFYNPDEDKTYEFEISAFKNDLLSFINFYRKENWDYIVYYNGLSFDAQVIQYVISNYKSWIDLDGLEIVEKIFECAQRVIDDKKHNLFAEYREEHFEIPIIDVFTINGLDGQARWSSLKKVEFQLDWFSVEEMPIAFDKEVLTESEIEEVKSYCVNDIMATFEVFKLTIGQTTHPIYKGNNQIELRLNVEEEFGIKCFNYSEIKLADELMKKSYIEAKNITAKELPRKGMFRKEVKLKNCIPKYVEFKTPLLKDLLKEIKSKSLKRGDKWEKEFTIGTSKYAQLLGGLHTKNLNEVWTATEDYIIEDDDAASYYPKILIENNYYPFHLGKELLNVYVKLYNRRMELKPLAKTDKKIKGIVDTLKLVCNSLFGKLGSMESWLYDVQALYSITLTGQFCLLMLIEEFELNGIKVISANSDGVTTYFHKDLLEKKQEIVKKWQELTKFEIETVRFKKFYYSTVNDYLAIKEDGNVKTKGDLISDFELWKNKSNRVVALALQEYFVKGYDPIKFIKEHKNIYDFCIMARSTGQLYLEEQWIEGDEVKIKKHKKLVRYYLCSDCTSQLYKRGTGSTGKPTNISQNAANDLGEIFICYFNKYEEKEMKDYSIDYNQYIYKALKIIDKIEHTKRTQQFVDSLKPQTQMTLF